MISSYGNPFASDVAWTKGESGDSRKGRRAGIDVGWWRAGSEGMVAGKEGWVDMVFGWME